VELCRRALNRQTAVTVRFISLLTSPELRRVLDVVDNPEIHAEVGGGQVQVAALIDRRPRFDVSETAHQPESKVN
jgi:hypothetical protein